MRNPPLLALVALLTGSAVSAQPIEPVEVLPTGETQPQAAAVAGALRDVALWVTPDGGSDGLVLTAYGDFNAGLTTFGLDGTRVDLEADGPSYAVAVHDGFPLGNDTVTLVLSALEGGVVAYRLAEQGADRVQRIGPVTFDPATTFGGQQSLALYRDPGSGRFHLFKAGIRYIEQFELSGQGGAVSATRVRIVDTGTTSPTISGLVVDEQSGRLFAMLVGEGLWRYGIAPDAGSEGKQVAWQGDGGRLGSTLGRLALYRAGTTAEGYLLAADPARSAYNVFERSSEVYVGSFAVVENPDENLAGARNPLAVAVVSRTVGTDFQGGILVAHNAQGAPENLLVMPWGAVADAFDPPLRGSTGQADGGTNDGGTDAGAFDAGPPVSPPGKPPVSSNGGDGCSCAAASVPASALFALLALALTGRRRRS
ncbi:phytase [Pyxidicoccus fallax]|uniref:Phytase n=1 Tax=Pyxidicoccus fallax TaxID=394095 RepID=A0A848L4S1_9BACT|nr:myxosortase-dependent phytase-like phosphatase [Pyxidicoccus fallax]NMO13714.1 phytase [Pyxidicoccus fallax]NPC80787.1 phytase [Pyxidicoccus fallax]